jgi:phosphoribosylanthranilate isomerase
MTRTRVKICGITQIDDARFCAEHGADAIGLVFYAKSPRAVAIDTAREILQQLPAFVTSVGLFVNPSVKQVEEVLQTVSLDCLQFHGDEDAAFCRQFGRPYIKAIRMQSGLDVAARVAAYPDAQGFLLDAYVEDVAGGTGQSFDWARVPKMDRQPFILAGGLHEKNVAEAIRIARPYAVDVSGGVEKSKGVKDTNKIQKFIEEVNHVDTSEV